MSATVTYRFSQMLDAKLERKSSHIQWPDPEASVGCWYRAIDHLHCWELRGPALIKYLSLASEIKKYLENHGEAVAAPVFQCAYMVGKTKSTANPTVFFCSRVAEARKNVKKEVDRSGIISNYPAFRTAQSNRPPHLDQLTQLTTEARGSLAMEVDYKGIGSSYVATQTLQSNGLPHSNEPSRLTPLSSTLPTRQRQPSENYRCDNPIGASILVKHNVDSDVVSPATMGMVLQDGDQFFLSTAAHAFTGEKLWEDADNEDFECDLDESAPSTPPASLHDSAYSTLGDSPPTGSRPSSTAVLDNHGRESLSSPIASSTSAGVLTPDDVVFTSSTSPSKHEKSLLDYCLVPLDRVDAKVFQQSTEACAPCENHFYQPTVVALSAKECKVVAYTGCRKARTGVLSGSPVFVTLPDGRSSQELWTVQLEGNVQIGDCGSIVVSEDSRELLGHIVAGSPHTGTAFLVPAHLVLADARGRFKSGLILSETSRAPNRRQALNVRTPTVSRASSQERSSDLNLQKHTIYDDTDKTGFAADDDALSQLDMIRDRVAGATSSMRRLFNAIRAPLPTQTGDGSQLPQMEPQSLSNDIKTVLREINRLGFDRVEDLAEVVKKSKLGQPLDDRMYLMERMIQAASMLPEGITSKTITNDFITTLWKDLDHPPQDLMADDFDFRQPDGSKNSVQYPHIGKAGMPYARTVAPQSLKQGAMPDPGVLFDSMMARKGPGGTEHPNRISSMLFYLASIIIHDAFKTNRHDYTYSDTSSYLDLAPLYGSTWAEQKQMRTMKNGKIKPDCFSETRLLSFPPGVGALLICFNRYHNYVVEQLALINEDGRFTENSRQPTVERYGEKINKRDDDLFQTGRLITCGLYVNIILIDYVRTILNLNRTDSNWQLNPRVEIPDGPPRGVGNQVSAEFNLVYRWHASVSERDDKWTQDLFRQMFPDNSPDQVSTPQGLPKFLRTLGMMEAESLKLQPDERPFPALERERIARIEGGPFKGSFEDDDLADMISAGIEDCANAMGPQQIPTVMKAIEILGITQARSWRVGTLNEFRKHFDLEPHRTFESVTKNSEVATALKHLYDTPDDIELYPGLVVEDAKERVDPGSGLCPSYTVSRGVLSDAVALVRGDRHYTTSYTPAALTNWGFQEASSDLTIDNGCVAYKLFLRALPNNFDPASVYVHYPFTTPRGKDGMQDILIKLGKASKYNFDRPAPINQPTVLFSYDAAKKVLEDQDTFHVTWGKAMEFLMGDAAKNFMLSGDGPANAQSRKLMEDALFLGGSSRDKPLGNEKWLKAVREYYSDITERLLADKTYALAGVKEVDIIRDVGNLAHVHFAAELFSLPLKTVDFPRGIFTEQQLYLVMAAVFICVFFDLDPPKSFPLRQQAHEATQQLGSFMQLQVAAIKATGSIASSLIGTVNKTAKPLQAYGVHMISHLLKQNDDVKDLVWGNIMGTMGGMVANQGQLFGQVLDYFFTTGRNHIPELHRLAKEDSREADDKLTHYLLEASRLNAETGVFRSVERDTTISDPLNPYPALREAHLKAGDKVMVNFRSASRDPGVWSTDASGGKVDPNALCLNHPVEKYIHLGHGAHQCLGANMTTVALTTMLKCLFKRENLRPAPVAYGRERGEHRIKKVVREFAPGDLERGVPEEWLYHAFLTEDWGMGFPFPTSLKVNWDA